MKFNKKAISELLSFILIILLIIVASTSAYLFSDNYLNDKISNLDYNNMKLNLNKMDYLINNIQNLDSSSSSIGISFSKGELSFENNQVKYQSLVSSSGDLCLDTICYKDNNGFDLLYINLSNSYNFDKNLSLTPGNYILSFKNLKNVSKIKIYLKNE